ncbi:hypothetical protein HELRODRAFT_78931 [Helobdella robusta]|uniref:LRP2-binding protein n=1 Tax=Helobdella robusta TaxID=6412 RepID=T1G3H4_HELRO|nr:hypothetical protein HELRODRAFT_78931 [Helobdella robusta]ESO04642.1 hypothetical protein HELRODRAFT_78931 [Helobdella robusta]
MLNVDDDYSLFLLGQYFYEQKEFEKAYHYFEIMANRNNFQSKYQAAVMCYDGLGTTLNQSKGFEMINELATSTDPKARNLYQAAAVNVGRAYFYGAGTIRSEELAEKFWKLAADGEEQTGACTLAQTTLGLFYSLPDHQNFEMAFHYHDLASKKGSLESIGALGTMYLHGMGVKENEEKGYQYLKEASTKGNLYAKGNLINYYYLRMLYTKAGELATTMVDITDIASASKETGCLEYFIKIGISMGCFFYARCLTLGRGVQMNETLARHYYSRVSELPISVKRL